MKTINILGTDYKYFMKNYDEDESFEKRSIDGYCDGYIKEIVICDMHTFKGWENEKEETIQAVQKAVLRHEIIHAFLNESGLMDNAGQVNGSWAINEEMIDWIAIQSPKIYKVFKELEILE